MAQNRRMMMPLSDVAGQQKVRHSRPILSNSQSQADGELPVDLAHHDVERAHDGGDVS